MDLRKLVREEIKRVLTEREMEGGWISPTNDMISLGSQTQSHSAYAYKYPHKVGIGTSEYESLRKEIKNKAEIQEAVRNLAILNGAVSYRVVKVQNNTQLVLIGIEKGIERSINKLVRDFRKNDLQVSVLVHEDIEFDSFRDLLSLPIKERYKVSLGELKDKKERR